MYLLFWFRKSGSKDEVARASEPGYEKVGSVCCRVTIDGQWAEIGSTHLKVRQGQWDVKNQKVKGGGATAKQQNKTLDDLRARLVRIFELLQVDNADVTAGMVKEIFLGKKLFRYSVGQLADSFFADREAELKAGLLTDSTMLVQRNYAKNFGWALERLGLKNMVPQQFSEDTLELVRVQLLAKGLGANHTAKHLKWIKQLWRWSLRKNRMRQNLLDGVVVKNLAGADPDTTHLSVEQLDTLIHFDFLGLCAAGYVAHETAVKLDRERDAFVFSCFTGMHHSDYVGQKYWLEPYREDVFLKGLRKKTNKEFAVKLLQPALTILGKYGGGIEQLPIKSNQRRNSSLKEMATFCRIPVLISTKIARKTFANFALNVLLMDADDVAACLGLTNTKCLKHYAKIKEMRIAKKMSSWDDVLRNK